MVKIDKLFFAAFAAFAFAACSISDVQPEQPETAPAEWTVSIEATKGVESPVTKALSESGNTITASWEEGDVVYILSKNGSKEFGQLTAQSSGATTKLLGTVTGTMTVGNTYILRYLQKGQDYLYLPSQKGTLEDIAKNHDMAEALVTVKSIDDGNVTFVEDVAVFESKISITKFTFSKSVVDVSIFSSNLKTYVRPGYSSNYSFVQVKPDEGSQTLYAAMSSLEAKKSVFTFLAKGTDGFYYVAAKQVQLENGKNYTADVTLTKMPEYVDLGIERDGHAICFATKNMGASGPGGVGNFYAWGETEPKTTYTWDNYPYGSYSWITKYDPDRPDQGVVDGLAALLEEDDAATVNLGPGWRMPNLDEFKDLLNSSLFEMIYGYADGRWGFLLRSLKDGYSVRFIFLPRTGYYKEDALTGTNAGYYWSRNIDQQSWTSSSFANTLQLKYVYSISAEWSRMDRAYGLPIRAVFVD